MAKTVQAAISLQTQQFVGYWGYGNPANLESRLTQAVAQGMGAANSGKTIFSATGFFHACHPDGTPLPQAWVRIQDNRLTLGREPFGRMSLYWTQMGQVIWFASRLSLLLPILELPPLELPPLESPPLKSPQIDLAALYGYSCFSYVPTPLSPIAGVAAIAAGTEQTWTAIAGVVSEPTWERSREWQEAPEQLTAESQTIGQLQTLLKDAVERQIADLNDEPVGVFLSGGLDSSIIAALLVQAGLKVRAYTLDFGSAGVPEYPYAEQVAHHLHIPLVKVDARPHRIREALMPTVQALDVPFGDGVTVPLFLLAKAASQETGVVFNGEGGDQIFAGWTNKPLIAAGLYQVAHPRQTDFAQQYLQTFHRLWNLEHQIFQPDILAEVKHFLPQDWIQAALDPTLTTSLLHRLRRASLMLKGAQNIQPRATNLAIAHGLKLRSPFCDLALAQFAFQISGTLHLQGSCEKYILKRAVASWLPAEIVWRTKRGMGVPLTSWCLNDLWHELGTWLSPGPLRRAGIWQPDIASRILAGELGPIQGRRMGESLWLLLMWQVWQYTVLGKSVLGEPLLGEPLLGKSLLGKSTLGRSIFPPSFDHPFWLPAWIGRPYLQFRRSIQQW